MDSTTPFQEDAFEAYPPPPLPYVKGRRFTVCSHNPPPPGLASESRSLTKEANIERRTVPPIQRCILHPPLGGSDGDIMVTFEVAHEIRAGEGHFAQVLAVNILNASPSYPKPLQGITTAVAKLYDPLYFDHTDFAADPFLITKYHYSRETASYTRLSDLQGTVIPVYYGSYSLELPVDESSSETRTVRLILIEYIPGSSMMQLQPQDFSQLERKQIMKHIIDAESDIYTRNVRLRDLHPRNVMVVQDPNSKENRIKRIVLLDFGMNILTRDYYGNPEAEQKYLPGTYISPLLRWHKVWGTADDFSDSGWVDWDYQPWLRAEYAHTASSVTPYMKSEFLSDFIFERMEMERDDQGLY
ncbi:hypothetical protein EMCG_05048 [[Emmonsia] crescens]|uniref:Protein kinase domain-containing protein n=1 Tax=[Emmonsia] crescens TaxID=73230 RepID=A0A0G2HQF7_9EURO|nr:hypothetical protein EMCG_05048 [Emmonsia crescens UAMH 3008]